MRATLFTNELLMALSGRQLPPRDMSAVGDKADLRSVAPKSANDPMRTLPTSRDSAPALGRFLTPDHVTFLSQA